MGRSSSLVCFTQEIVLTRWTETLRGCTQNATPNHITLNMDSVHSFYPMYGQMSPLIVPSTSRDRLFDRDDTAWEYFWLPSTVNNRDNALLHLKLICVVKWKLLSLAERRVGSWKLRQRVGWASNADISPLWWRERRNPRQGVSVLWVDLSN